MNPIVSSLLCKDTKAGLPVAKPLDTARTGREILSAYIVVCRESGGKIREGCNLMDGPTCKKETCSFFRLIVTVGNKLECSHSEKWLFKD
jgi:hypothetical protein